MPQSWPWRVVSQYSMSANAFRGAGVEMDTNPKASRRFTLLSGAPDAVLSLAGQC